MSYIGAEPTTAAFPFDQFSGNGSTTAFTLTYAPASATSIIVAISGVMQNPNLYSVVGTTLTFSPAPPTGTNNISVLYLGLPVIGSSSPGNTAFLSSTDLTATAGQTVFASAGSYTPGFVQVFRNGARLGNADFTATNGTTITLANAATAGDLVTLEYYTLTSLTNALPLTGGTVTGSVTFNSLISANGGGIQFPATQVPSANANTLDDYEEGTWTPTIIGSGGNPTVTYASANTGGRYTKTGNFVFVTFEVRWSAISGGSGNVSIGGLPFARVTSSNPDGDSGFIQLYGVTFSGVPGLRAVSGQTYLNIESSVSGAATSNLTVSNLTGGLFLRGSICYQTA